jgi:hypothetical protein
MPEGGVRRRRKGARVIGSWCARLVTLTAALMLAAGGSIAERAHARGAEPGFVMVICSDGATRTIVVDGDGNPIGPSQKGPCGDRCDCCPVPRCDALPPRSDTTAQRWPGVVAEVLHDHQASPRPQRGLRPFGRGPPSEEPA